ncbi:PQQ-binding-like beta-propeller repeat protein [Dactylosporangium sp. NBC_01737]|uniref:outer membrane protein assembly factor BamB family protein n=1 Tax=Dactylosporangium sp. NBC_01737 TaxID=2975959 RepID=UPI002E0E6A01|nr:PQQ-binding-like beta-propeller repeat protein [Dactylosporangium sp. NBC_01737]
MVPVALLLSAAPAGLALAFPGVVPPPAAAVTETDAGWRQDGNGPGRAGYQPVTPYLTTGSAIRLGTVWTAPASRPEEQVGGAVVADGTLLRSSGGPTGQIRRYDAVTGADLGPVLDVPGRWFGRLAAPPAGRRAGLLVESQTYDAVSGNLLQRHLSAYTTGGEAVWDVLLPDEVSGGYTVAGDVVLRAAGTTLTASRLTDGTTAWTAPLDGEAGLHPPVADAGLALQTFETAGGTGLAAFDLRTGTRVWRQDVSGPWLIAAGGVAYTTGTGGVCAYTAADGARRWCDTTTLRDPRSATTDGQTLMVFDAHGHAAGFGAGDGKVRWTRDWGAAGAEVSTSYWSPVNGGGVLYGVVYQFLLRDGAPVHRTELLALDAADGTVLTRQDLAFDALHGAEPLLLSGDHVYFAALEKLIALGVR